ncbi:hypothetical protein [Methanococcoides seepicolus]|uniref:Uncharacterized protein n=1 Tax=Methanococcoides seepicolus TaxID=2828780 RepID=A0A9E4ZGY5_9EURY|nr:hypothetical protein [Methanococcoides seepicolus]MCM1987678.1 hypothetical protein [Methanococcoides seepicolus]
MLRKDILRIGTSTIIGIVFLCASIIFVLNLPSEDTLQTEEPKITQNNTSYMEFHEELASTTELITVPIGGFHTNFIRLKPGEI